MVAVRIGSLRDIYRLRPLFRIIQGFPLGSWVLLISAKARGSAEGEVLSWMRALVQVRPTPTMGCGPLRQVRDERHGIDGQLRCGGANRMAEWTLALRRGSIDFSQCPRPCLLAWGEAGEQPWKLSWKDSMLSLGREAIEVPGCFAASTEQWWRMESSLSLSPVSPRRTPGRASRCRPPPRGRAPAAGFHYCWEPPGIRSSGRRAVGAPTWI